MEANIGGPIPYGRAPPPYAGWISLHVRSFYLFLRAASLTLVAKINAENLDKLPTCLMAQINWPGGPN